MYARPKSREISAIIGAVLTLGILFAIAFGAQPSYALTCEGGVLKDGASIMGSCSTTGAGTDVTCDNGALKDAGGANVGTCTASQQASGDLLRDGIFGCNANKYANVGSLSAIGGVYVPVNDAAVTLNTGYLVYKECVLDGVTAKISEAARTQLTGTVLKDINTGRKGKARYITNLNINKELQPEIYKIASLTFKEENVGVMCPAHKTTVVSAVARRFVKSQTEGNASIACTMPKSGEATWETIYALADPANTPVGAYFALEEQLGGEISTFVHNQEQDLLRGNGFYSVTDDSDDPLSRKILTPSYLVSQGAQQAFTSGFRCLEGADELSEVCAPLFSAMVPESFSSGLANMTKAQNGLPSYVNRMVSEASAAVRGEAVNVALNVILTARQFEAAFLQAKESAATLLTNAIVRLRGTEKTCWEMIIYNTQGPHVCTAPPQGNKCTAVSGGQLTIATSTQFSDAVVSQITPLATEVAGDITKSAQALKELDQLATTVSDASSAANQRQALSRLDQLVAPNSRLPDCSPQKTLHSAGDVQCANKQRDDISGAIGTLVEETIRKWGDSTLTNDPNVSWCDINNPAVIQKWTDAWKK